MTTHSDKDKFEELWVVKGWSKRHNMLVVEDLRTGDRRGIYLSTGAPMLLPLTFADGGAAVYDGNNYKESWDFIDPPKGKNE